MPEEQLLFATEDQMHSGTEPVAEVQTIKYLTFISDQLRYGITAEQVVEIITNHPITLLPRVPHYVRGIINLRGQIIPIVDIRLRLGKPPEEDKCVIIVDMDGSHIGILVDDVENMVDIPKDSILPVPTQSAQRLVSGMCSLAGGGTMLVLDCEQLIHE